MSQETITQWFNQTYSKRGLNYLRPKEAYYIFYELLGVEPEGKLLDVACGPGQMLSLAKEYNLHAFGLDISDVAIKMAQQKLPDADLRVGNAEQLPYENETFDYISCLGSLERIINLETALKEQYRVAKKGAKVCYLVRNSERASWKIVKEKLGIINKKGHQGAKSKKEWSGIFEKIGYKIEKIHHDQWPSVRWSRWMSLNGTLGKVNYKKIQPTMSNIDQAYEFIYILSKP